MSPEKFALLQAGTVIPAHPLCLSKARRLDERRQRALSRYYLDAGVGGLAVGVHTTQFAIRDPKVGLFEPVLQLGIEEMRAHSSNPLAIAGICGETSQAVSEATLVKELGYDAGLLSLAALPQDASVEDLVSHCRAVAEILPVIGFYLQPAVGGRVFPMAFWRAFAGIENVVAIKIAPFNRYQTIDVVRAVAEVGREDIALYTGNDDNIVVDLLTPYRFQVNGTPVERRIVGGLLGHWAVWARTAVAMWERLRDLAKGGHDLTPEVLALSIAVTDTNAAFFDAANGYGGCIAGLHEVLRRQGLLEGLWCLDPHEGLGKGQLVEIDRVYAAYPEVNDDQFVAENRERWLRG